MNATTATTAATPDLIGPSLLLLGLTLQAAGQGSTTYYTSGDRSVFAPTPAGIIGRNPIIYRLISPDKKFIRFPCSDQETSSRIQFGASAGEHFNEKYLESEKFPETNFHG